MSDDSEPVESEDNRPEHVRHPPPYILSLQREGDIAIETLNLIGEKYRQNLIEYGNDRKLTRSRMPNDIQRWHEARAAFMTTAVISRLWGNGKTREESEKLVNQLFDACVGASRKGESAVARLDASFKDFNIGRKAYKAFEDAAMDLSQWDPLAALARSMVNRLRDADNEFMAARITRERGRDKATSTRRDMVGSLYATATATGAGGVWLNDQLGDFVGDATSVNRSEGHKSAFMPFMLGGRLGLSIHQHLIRPHFETAISIDEFIQTIGQITTLALKLEQDQAQDITTR